MRSVVVVLTLCVMLGAANASADTHVAASCSLADVQAAVTAASRGDTVTVPACAETQWTAPLSITKAITLQGAGETSTYIRSNFSPGSTSWFNAGNCLIYFLSSSASADENETLRITGFNFHGNDLTGAIYIRQTSWSYPLRKVVIDNNIFSHPGNSGGDYTDAIETYGAIYGVIHSNVFNGHTYLSASSLGSTMWNYTTASLGSADMLYVEDNEFNGSARKPGGKIFSNTVGTGGRGVFRYNTYRKQVSYSYNDAGLNCHGDYGTNVYGAMACEYYGNYLIDDYYDSHQIVNMYGLRGGISMVFNNFFNAYDAGDSRIYEHETDNTAADSLHTTSRLCPSGTLYAGTYSCASDGQPQHVWRTYLWNNRYGATASGSVVPTATRTSVSPERQLRNNTDYFLYTTTACVAGGACTEGTGCGSSLPTTCTRGTGFWLTSQSCSSVPTGSYGMSPSTPIAGALYRCDPVNTWTSHYTPYTYPHPLRGGSDTTPPTLTTPCAGATTCTKPIVEIACGEGGSTQDVYIGATSTEATDTVYVCPAGGSCDADATYDEVVTAGQQMTGRWDNYFWVTPKLTVACGATHTYWASAKDASNNKMTAPMAITFAVASGTDVTGPTLSPSGGTHRAAAATNRVWATSSEACAMRYCIDGAGTPACTSSTAWTARTDPGTGMTTSHVMDIALPSSTASIVHLMCRDASDNDSANLAYPITTDAAKTIGTGTNTLSVGSGTNTLEVH